MARSSIVRKLPYHLRAYWRSTDKRGSNSCCNAGRELPVVEPLPPAGQHLRIVGGARYDGPEDGSVHERAALTVCGVVQQVAFGREVAVAVGPRARGARDQPIDRVGWVGQRPRRAEAFQILVERDLERGLAVPEQIVGRAHLRRDVVQAVVVDLVEPHVEVWRQGRWSNRLWRVAVCEGVVADTARERPSADGPFVLRKESEVAVHVHRDRPRRDPVDNLRRNAVREVVEVRRRRVGVAGVLVMAVGVVETDLEAVRADLRMKI